MTSTRQSRGRIIKQTEQKIPFKFWFFKPGFSVSGDSINGPLAYQDGRNWLERAAQNPTATAIEIAKIGNIYCLESVSAHYALERTLVANVAASNGHLEMVQYLETKGILCTRDGANGAASNGHLKMVQYLETKGIVCTQEGADWAAENGHLEMVQYLGNRGIVCTHAGADGAAKNKHLETVQYLENQGILRTHSMVRMG